MVAKVIITKVNETYVHVDCDPGVSHEIRDAFTFSVPGAQFSPQFKHKIWDGKIRLFNTKTSMIYGGLSEAVANFCTTAGYNVLYKPEIDSDITPELIDRFIEFLKLPLEVRQYQKDAIYAALSRKKVLLLSPTSSGKSLIIYIIARFLLETKRISKGLIIVPTVSLVQQMYNDFVKYGYKNIENHVHKISAGSEKNVKHKLVISTWQSLYKDRLPYFQQYEMVIGDEAHLYKAKSLTGILEKCTKAPYRVGTTGTLDGTQTNKLVLTGLFGPVINVITTKELMDSNFVTELKIKAITLTGYPKFKASASYQEEIDFLISSPERNDFITDLALSLEGNTLVLYRLVERHGQVLYDQICKKDPSRSVYFIHGDVDANDRTKIKAILEKEQNAILVASAGTFSTGESVNNLHNVIFGHPTKAKINTLQSIGRVLRLSSGKKVAKLFDISDDLRYSKSQAENTTLKHFKQRLLIYASEKFNFSLHSYNLKDKK